MYIFITLLYAWNQYNIVNQLKIFHFQFQKNIVTRYKALGWQVYFSLKNILKFPPFPLA